MENENGVDKLAQHIEDEVYRTGIEQGMRYSPASQAALDRAWQQTMVEANSPPFKLIDSQIHAWVAGKLVPVALIDK